MNIDNELRKTISEKFFEMGNLFVAGWCIGTLISTGLKLKWIFVITGFTLGVLFYIFGIIIAKSGGNK